MESSTLNPEHAHKAARYSRVAAQRAEQQTAWDEAAEHYERCLSAIEGSEDGLGEDRAALNHALGRCRSIGEQYRPAWRAVLTAIDIYRERQDWVGAARATVDAIAVPAPSQRHMALLDAALDAAGERDRPVEARLLVERALAEGADATQADADLAAAARLAEEHDLPDVRARLKNYEALASLREGRIDDAVRLQLEQAELHRQSGEHNDAADALFRASLPELLAGRLDDAEIAGSRALAYAREVHDRFNEQRTLAQLASLALMRDDADRARQLQAEISGDTFLDLYITVWMAELAGSLDAAYTYRLRSE